jgi:polysaccharide export outer membrane protein
MFTRRTLIATLGVMIAAPALAREAQPEAPLIRFSDWSDDEPLYLFYPGDKLEVNFASATELSRTTQVGPDGRITLPMIGQVMAAYKSVPQLQAEIQAEFTPILRNPAVTVFPGDAATTRVLVGGEVKNPGWVEVMGDMDALQAVLAAGGFLHSAKTHQVVLIRRGRDGQAMRRLIDVQDMLNGRNSQMIALRRFDMIYVPRTNIAEAGVWVEQWVNNLIPGGILNYFAYRSFN